MTKAGFFVSACCRLGMAPVAAFAQDMGEFPDFNLAELLQRITRSRGYEDYGRRFTAGV